VIAGLEYADSGTILFEDEDITGRNAVTGGWALCFSTTRCSVT